MRCKRCANEERQAALSDTPAGASGDYFPEGRYGVMCVSGFSAAAESYDSIRRNGARHGFVFYVVDCVSQGHVVCEFKGRGDSLSDRLVLVARGRAIRVADRLNVQDAEYDAA